MRDFDPRRSFGERVAASYDDELRGDEDACVAFLRELAGDGPALELAVGTGRIALPLAATGLHVDGVDLSPAMVARLREKPGGAALDVALGDFADVPVDGTYPLVYVVYNTFFNLLSQDDQVRCFANVAAHLEPGGAFVLEAYVPAFLHRLRNHQYVDAESVELHEVRLDVARHDPVTQRLDESHVALTEDGLRVTPIVQRYAWPSELDLMARMAGLARTARWADWSRTPFTADSARHVSVYRRPEVASGPTS